MRTQQLLLRDITIIIMMMEVIIETTTIRSRLTNIIFAITILIAIIIITSFHIVISIIIIIVIILSSSLQISSPYNLMVHMHRLLQRNYSQFRLFGFRADPPTTTSQRLKSITTGTLPTFVDIGE
jgi:predicted AlkP superfamily pyrophosphatase or phosphodiesterase